MPVYIPLSLPPFPPILITNYRLPPLSQPNQEERRVINDNHAPPTVSNLIITAYLRTCVPSSVPKRVAGSCHLRRYPIVKPKISDCCPTHGVSRVFGYMRHLHDLTIHC